MSCVCPGEFKPVGVYSPIDTPKVKPIVPIGTTITLSREETDLCISIARERHRKNIEQKTTNFRYSKGRSDEDLHIQGVFGELAFCKIFSLPIEIYDTSCRNVITEVRFDAVFPNGWNVDVKTTIYNDADIRVTSWKKLNPPTLYSLVIHTNGKKDIPLVCPENPLPELSFRGLITSEQMFDPSNIKKIPQGGGVFKSYFCVAQSRLKTFEEIKKELE